MALIDNNGNDIVEETLIISKQVEEFVFENLDVKPTLSINRDFSAPVIVEQEHNEFSFLMKHDRNSFVRYESSQSFAVETLEAMMSGEKIDEEFIAAFGYLLDLDVELSYKALLLELPTISTFMQRQEVIDFEPIYEAKEKLSQHLATTYKEKLLELYESNHKPLNQDIDSLSMGERALKNRCLRLLSTLESDAIIDLVSKQYGTSLTMTDRVVSLDILENTTELLSELALSDFYAKYSNDTLVMNKYFSILSASEREGTLDRVIALQNDAAYDEKVPNLVRSLIGVFARNYKHFHSKDGDGYKFVADKIIEIDAINPQMASGLCAAFKIYEKLNKTNKVMMKAELMRVVSTQSLSKNVYEIVSKILKID